MNWSKIKYFRPFFVYPPLALLMLGYALRHNIFGPLATLALFISGVIEWTLMEYFFHRYPLHLKRGKPWLQWLLSGRHLTHHRYSQELKYMFVPVGAGLSLSAIWMG